MYSQVEKLDSRVSLSVVQHNPVVYYVSAIHLNVHCQIACTLSDKAPQNG